jgi:hypothetical protein
MPFIVNGDGHLEVGPPDGDPLREDNARRVAEFAARLEQESQVFDAFDAENERRKAEIAGLQKRVAFLEQMLLKVSQV